jgi:hypothetical protein
MTHEHDYRSLQANYDEVSGGFTLFVSYSRRDASIVEPLVELLRISGSSVFRDRDSIPPGTKWQLKIATALENCETVIVLWCKHAAASKEVELEYQRAIELEKSVVPILIDSTGMPDVLAQYQAIDLRKALGAHEVVVIDGLETACRVGRASLVLRTPSDEELQRGGQSLIAQLYTLIVSRKHDA